MSLARRVETAAKAFLRCPVCQICSEPNLGEHLLREHGEEAFKKAVLEAKQSGLSDAQIGAIFGITFRQLERIVIEAYGANISTLQRSRRITSWEPKGFREETTTVWSYPKRGDWATHHGGYRGNWSPYIPRNVILKYSQPGDLVLDYFVGGGTTAVEAKLLHRRCIAKDINPVCVTMTKEHLDFTPPKTLFEEGPVFEPVVSVGDARDLSDIEDGTIDLICAHPPYAGIINYSTRIEGDLSGLDVPDFLEEMRKVARESFRVLKPGGKCAILIGDTRKRKHVVPIGFALIGVFLEAGFALKELVIKRQHNCKTTGFWKEKSLASNFLLLAHEYLPIFEKKPNRPVCSSSYSSPSSNIGVRLIDPVPLAHHEVDLETTSVWILPEEEYNAYLDVNVIQRYAQRGSYLVLSIEPSSQEAEPAFSFEPLALLFIKSPVLLEIQDRQTLHSYLELLKRLLEQRLPQLTPGGFLVVETRDVRVDGYIEPMGKHVIDALHHQKLWLKEIVIATSERKSPLPPRRDDENLEIVHQYLLVYEVLE
uniref:Methyltransferase domain-containing protein n=1 Tax=Candidatus Caldatribacterium saccharofermentans TaxID=1454753 RepID=A0A7V4TI90_9BACT